MSKEERELVETASEAFEQFDSIDKVLEEAKKAAEWIKCSNHCVAFTGMWNCLTCVIFIFYNISETFLSFWKLCLLPLCLIYCMAS